MNIFFLDRDPILAATNQCDCHVVKMVLESAQLLSTAHQKNHREKNKLPIYKITHPNHPCTHWVESGEDNYLWLAKHAKALLDEYYFRYGKVHKSTPIINWCAYWIPNIPEGWTEPAQAMPDEFKDDDPVEAYRNYYVYKSQTLKRFRYSRREMPKWLVQNLNVQKLEI